VKKTIFGLTVCMALLSFESHAGTDVLSEQIEKLIVCLNQMKSMLLNANLGKIYYEQENPSNTNQEKTPHKQERPYLKNKNFIEFRKQLKGFNSALQNSGTTLNVILNKGRQIFENKKNNQFFTSEDLPSTLKDSYSNALNSWKKIKRMPISDEKYDEKLNNFREKIRSLYQDIQN